MASTQKLRSGKWRARYRDGSGREHARHFDRRVDAQTWLDSITASVVRGDYVDPRAGRTTLSQYATLWEATQVVSDSTASINDNALRVHVLPALGDRPLASILRSDVQAFVKTSSVKLSPGSVRNVYDVLYRVLDAAVDDRMIPANPCRRIALPRANAVEVNPPTPKQVQVLAEAVTDRYSALVWFLAGSGLRIGEALGLDVGHIDFLRRTVRVERQARQDGTIVAETKGKRARTVPIGEVVIDVLAAHLAEYPSDGPLFVDDLGRRLTYRRWKRIWNEAKADLRAAAERAAKMPEAERPTVVVPFEGTTHDLRHFTASALIARGASVKQVQTVLGHASAAITLRTYAHLWPGDEDRTRDAMDAVLGPVGPADSLRTEAASND